MCCKCGIWWAFLSVWDYFWCLENHILILQFIKSNHLICLTLFPVDFQFLILLILLISYGFFSTWLELISHNIFLNKIKTSLEMIIMSLQFWSQLFIVFLSQLKSIIHTFSRRVVCWVHLIKESIALCCTIIHINFQTFMTIIYCSVHILHSI